MTPNTFLNQALYVKNIGRAVEVDRIDHLVLTVKDIDATVDFYQAVIEYEKGQLW